MNATQTRHGAEKVSNYKDIIRKSIPTVSFASERGAEAAFCEAVRR